MEYKLRELQSGDLFSMFRILSKIGVKELKTYINTPEIKAAITEAKDGGNESSIEGVGMGIFLGAVDMVLGKMDACQDDVYQFLSSLSGISKKEIAVMPLADFTNMLVDVIKKDEFKDFFKAASKLLK